jgi:N-acetyl-beta-hexosaminidase
MFDFKELEKRYQTDAPFNAMVRCFTSMIKEHGFTPSEIREGLFLAQYRFETQRAERVIRTEKEWEQFYAAKELLRQTFTFTETPEPRSAE